MVVHSNRNCANAMDGDTIGSAEMVIMSWENELVRGFSKERTFVGMDLFVGVSLNPNEEPISAAEFKNNNECLSPLMSTMINR